MINLIIGTKGSGKTSQMVDDLNDHAMDNAQNVVCIERGRRLDRYVRYQIRLIDISEYPVDNFSQLLSFIAGISAKDFDITHIYIDSIFKVANSEDYGELEKFLNDLKEFTKDQAFTIHVLLSAEMHELSEGVAKYVTETI